MLLFCLLVLNFSYNSFLRVLISFSCLTNLILLWLSCGLIMMEWKSYAAAIGDVTITEDRLKYVDFTASYAESGLSMIVTEEFKAPTWMFTKPFTWQMWLATGAVLIYTMVVVWYLEREPNPEFHGNLQSQISTALTFTFSSLFFAHSEYHPHNSINNNDQL